MSKLSEELIAQIPPLYQELGTYTAVAKRLGINPSTVSKYVKLFNTQDAAPAKKTKRVKITSELIEEINEYFEFNVNISETARKFGIAPTTVKKYLTKENLEAAAQQSEDRSKLIEYVKLLFGDNVSKWNYVQMGKFNKQGIGYKAQYLTLKYWFEVQQQPIEKAKGSIGIIPYQFEDARTYYMNLLKKRKINREKLRKQKENGTIKVDVSNGFFVPPNREKKLIDLDTLSDAND